MTATFYDTQPDEVRAVLDLASLIGEGYGPQIANIAATFLPGHVDTVGDIADQLAWIERLGCEDAATVLRAYHGDPTMRFVFADQCADELSAQLRADVITSAQLVASLRRALVSA